MVIAKYACRPSSNTFFEAQYYLHNIITYTNMSSEPADLFTAKPINSAARLDGPSSYVIRQARRSRQGEEDLKLLDLTTTLYVGNLSFFTTEEQIHELFSK